MFNLIKSVIGYTFNQTMNTYDSYIVYTSCVLILILTVVFIDLVFKVFRAFIPRNWH